MGGIRNGAAEENWGWDLNPGMQAMLEGWDHMASEAGETLLGRQGVKGLSGGP